MRQSLLVVFPFPVICAFAALVVLLLAVIHVLAGLGKPVAVKIPGSDSRQPGRDPAQLAEFDVGHG